MEIRIEDTTLHERDHCFMCGKDFKINAGIQAFAWEVEERGRVWVGSVCPDCIIRGPEVLPATMRSHATKLREQATKLEQLAAEPLSMPSADEWKGRGGATSSWDSLTIE